MAAGPTLLAALEQIPRLDGDSAAAARAIAEHAIERFIKRETIMFQDRERIDAGRAREPGEDDE